MIRAISKTTSQKIMNMGVFAMFMIVTLHCPWKVSAGLEQWLFDFYKAFFRIAVPFFFAVSGYMLAGHFEQTSWYMPEIKKRIRSLVVPFFIWAVVGTVLYGLLTMRAGNVITLEGVLTSAGLNPVKLPAFSQLWYVRALFVLVILSPVIRRFNSPVFLLLSFGVYVLVCPRGEDLSETQLFFRITLSAEGFFYFAIGSYLRTHAITIGRKYSITLLALGLIGMVAFVLIHQRYLDNNVFLIRTFSIPLVLQGIWSIMPDAKIPVWLTRNTFAGFLSHNLIIAVTRMVHFDHIESSLLTSALYSSMVFMISSVVVPETMRKFMPKMANVLFGGR